MNRQEDFYGDEIKLLSEVLRDTNTNLTKLARDADVSYTLIRNIRNRRADNITLKTYRKITSALFRNAGNDNSCLHCKWFEDSTNEFVLCHIANLLGMGTKDGLDACVSWEQKCS